MALVLLSAFAAQSASAQVNSNASTVALNAVMAETLGITASPSTVNFTLAPGSTAAGSAPVVVSSSWVLSATRGTVNLYAWFGTPAAALTDGASTPDNIPSSEVYASLPNGIPTAMTSFSQSNTLGAANGGLKLYTQTLSSSNRESSRSDSVSLQINLASQPQLPAGTYTGTLNVQVQAL
ncbi:MAG: hypothetical protein ACRYFU_24805 [Janthinobacterium lividum]